MRDVASTRSNYDIQPDKSLVVFMRPSGLGFAVEASVFDVTTGQPEFVGIISAKTKLAHYVPPGKRTFMVVSESADFMSATLDAGKAYYALVTPRMGMWRARFSLRGVPGADVDGEQFAAWYKDCRWVENTDASYAWAKKNMRDIGNKLADKQPQWEAKAEKNRRSRRRMAGRDCRGNPFPGAPARGIGWRARPFAEGRDARQGLPATRSCRPRISF